MLLGVSAGTAALLLSTGSLSAQVGDPKASPQDNPAGHVGSGPDERSRDNNDSARDTDTRDTTRSASHTASEDEPITGTRAERLRTTRSRDAITNRGQRSSSGLPANQQQEYSQGNVTEGSSIREDRFNDRSTSAADRFTTSSDASSDTEASDTRTARRSRYDETERSDSTSSARSRDSARDADRDTDREARSDADDSERTFSRDEDRASAASRRSNRDEESADDSRASRSRERDDRFADRDARSDYRDTSTSRNPFSRDSYRDEDRFTPRSDDRYSSRDEDRYSSRDYSSRDEGRYTARDADRYTRDYDRGAYERGTELGRDVRDTARAARETARDVRDTVRGTRDAIRDTVRSTRDSTGVASSVRGATFDVDTVRPADVGVWFNRSTRNGLVVSNLAASGPISRVGFREGDQIVSVNGTRVGDPRSFMQYLFASDIRNQRVPVVVYRNGARQTVYVQPATLVDYYTSVQNNPLDLIGIVPDDRYYDRVVVWRVLPRTPAYYAGLQAGDVITAWDNARISRPSDLTQMVQETPPGEVEVQVYRGRQPRELSIDIPQLASRETRRTAYRPDIDAANVDTARRFNASEGTIARPGYVPAPGTYVEPGATVPAPAVEERPGVLRPGGILRGGLLPRR
jgi:hypothetical protein